MADRDAHLHGVLDGYAKFLQDKDLALDKHQPHLVRWVRDFLLFARAHGGYSFQQTLDLFLAEVGGRVGTTPWQLQQASAAIRIYRYQYLGAKAEDDDGPTVSAFVDDAARLERLRKVIRDARGQTLFLVSAPVFENQKPGLPPESPAGAGRRCGASAGGLQGLACRGSGVVPCNKRLSRLIGPHCVQKRSQYSRFAAVQRCSRTVERREQRGQGSRAECIVRSFAACGVRLTHKLANSNRKDPAPTCSVAPSPHTDQPAKGYNDAGQLSSCDSGDEASF